MLINLQAWLDFRCPYAYQLPTALTGAGNKGQITSMPTPISDIRNLGPAFEENCARAGIHTAEELRALGPDEAYARLLDTGTRPHFIGYYVLVMGLQGRPWNDCKGQEKIDLRMRFDVLMSEAKDKGLGAFEQILDEIGVIDRRS